ncbi:hypothetical protein PybrP1_000491 [[Pythium] brassicae (nom. inval.)]|nr:hypothetical protein PybrP1_000491 [[Pythium] brassicae (nom. inval.)]
MRHLEQHVEMPQQALVRVVGRVEASSMPLLEASASRDESAEHLNLAELSAAFDATYQPSLHQLDAGAADELFISEASTVELTRMEVDGERVRDLLAAPPHSADIAVRQRVDEAVVVHGLSQKRVATVREGKELARGVATATKPTPKPSMCTGSPASDKENQPVPAPNIRVDDEPGRVAKQLIATAIELEKKRRFCSAFCLFARARHVLPAASARLEERMKQLLATECPDAAARVPSQQMSTPAFVRLVLERDLLELLNSASAAQLVDLPAIGDKRAERIVASRPFSQLSDLLRVQGITDSAFQKLNEHSTAWPM